MFLLNLVMRTGRKKILSKECGTGLILQSPLIGRETELLEFLQALLCAQAFAQAIPHIRMPLPSLLSPQSFETQLEGHLLLQEASLDLESVAICLTSLY